jgi:membrane protein YdbS with pleckstrin-like domain
VAFPKRLLIPGEELVLDLRPHWIALALPTLATIVILVVMIVAYEAIDSSAGDIAVGVVGLALILAYPVPHLIRWLTSNFVVTSDRLIHREGFIAKRSVEIPLEAINDVRFHQGVFERIIGAGDLNIRSAADATPNTFNDVRKPESVQKTVYHQMELNSQRMYSGLGTPGEHDDVGSRASPSAVTELERLADLRSKGILTEEEFQTQKAKILGPPPRSDV